MYELTRDNVSTCALRDTKARKPTEAPSVDAGHAGPPQELDYCIVTLVGYLDPAPVEKWHRLEVGSRLDHQISFGSRVLVDCSEWPCSAVRLIVVVVG